MKKFSKVFLGLGLLLLFTSPVTYFLSAGPALAGAKAALGMLLLAAWFTTRDTSEVSPVGGMGAGTRSAFYYSSSTIMTVATVALLAGINFIAAKRSKTWDLTAKKIYSLSPQSQQVLKDLKDPVTAIGFIPAKHEAYDALEALFKKYASESDKFKYEFKDPLKWPDLAAKYQLKEKQMTVVLTREGPTGGAHTSLDVLSEQELTNALIKLNTVTQQKVYWLQGHGEYPIAEPPQGTPPDTVATGASELRRNLEQEGYAPEALSVMQANEIPKDASLLVIAAPHQKFTEREKQLLTDYLEQGGRLVYFAEALNDSGLEELFTKYGIKIEPGVLADNRINPDSPYQVITPYFADHEITRHLKAMQMYVAFAMARGLTILREGTAPDVTALALVTTSPYAWIESTPDNQPHLDSGERAGSIPVVAVAVRETRGAKDKRYDEARLLVIGNGAVIMNGNWGESEANRNLVLNGIAWASAQSAKITIRPPDRDVSTIDLSDETMTRIRFASLDLLPVLLVATGLVIWMLRRNQ